MNMFGMMSQLTPEFKKKLEEIRTRCEKADTGTCNFLEVNANPVTSLYMISGKTKPDGTKEVHMSFEQEPSGFPKMPDTNLGCDKEGYKMYLTKLKSDYDLGKSEKFSGMQFLEWKARLYEICDIIDAVIRNNHGIKCFEDGDCTNDNIKNVMFLHVCDVMNLHMNKKRNMETTLLIKNKLLKELKSSTVDILTSSVLDASYMKFFEENIDHLYTNYCYYGNSSFLPIRTHIAENDTVFNHSKFFMNNVHYAKHQIG
jgi:hypothetical protein